MIELQLVDRRHQMLESEVHHEQGNRNDHSGYHDKVGRTLKFFPRRPRDFLGQLNPGLLAIVNELSHL